MTIVLSTLALVALSLVDMPTAHAAGRARPMAPPGAGPVSRPLPAGATRNHGYPQGQRPPVVPPGTRASARPRRLPSSEWAALPRPGARRPAAAPVGSATNVLARSGYALDDTSIVVYFDVPDPGPAAWSSWLVTVYDPDTQTAQDSIPLSPAAATRCQVPRQYCRSFGTADGWSLTDGHTYFVTVTATLADGTRAVSDPSGTAKARTVASPPPVPAAQAAGCACPDLLSPTTVAQAVRGIGVETGTGGFTMSFTDLRMAGFGAPFEAVRRYSSLNTTAGSMGVGWAWTYDARVIPPADGLDAVTVRAEDGAQAVYTRAADGSYTRPPGVRSTLAASGTGWRLTTSDQIGYTFDSTGRLISIRNSRGLGTTVSYAATSWTITDAAGRNVIVKLGSDGLIRSIALPDGRTVRYEYRNGQLSAMTDADGATWCYGYAGGLLTAVIDPQFRTQVTNRYASGRVVAQVDATGASTTYAWDPGRQEATTTDADRVRVYDGYHGNALVYTQNGNGDVTNQRYDAAIDPNLVVDPQGNQTVKSYDAGGNPTSTLAPDPFAFAVSSSYDPHNNLVSHTDGLGNTAGYGYTAFDELQQITDPGGGVTKRQLDSHGLVTSVTDPRGNVTTMTYDSAGNLTSRTTPMGEKTTYTYDGTGRPVTMTSARGNLPGAQPAAFTTRYQYDNLDRVRKTYDPGKSRPFESVYDSLGQLIQAIDPLGDTTSYGYTKVIGRTATVTDPNHHTTAYTYTTAGRRASVTDAAGDRTAYTYDSRGNWPPSFRRAAMSPVPTRPTSPAGTFTTRTTTSSGSSTPTLVAVSSMWTPDTTS